MITKTTVAITDQLLKGTFIPVFTHYSSYPSHMTAFIPHITQPSHT